MRDLNRPILRGLLIPDVLSLLCVSMHQQLGDLHYVIGCRSPDLNPLSHAPALLLSVTHYVNTATKNHPLLVSTSFSCIKRISNELTDSVPI